MSGPRRIPAHAGDGTPNLGRQTIDMIRIPGIVVPCLTAASKCELIGKAKKQNCSSDCRKPHVKRPHASLPFLVEDDAMHSLGKDYQERR